MTQIVDISKRNVSLVETSNYLADILAKNLGYNDYRIETNLD
jgi:hypothetical protein